MRKKRPFLSLFGLIIILVLGPLAYFRFIKPKLTSAAWFDDGWYYRKAVNITNSSGSVLTDFQVSISIGTSANIVAGKMKSDCSDIRITDTNGKLLSHWVEENNPGCNTATDTKVWVKVPSIPTSGGTVYVYYGNPSATNVADGNKVFEFFDDFTKDLSKWSTESGATAQITTDSGNKVLSVSGSSSWAGTFAGNESLGNIIFETRIKATGASNRGGVFFRHLSSNDTDNGYYLRISEDNFGYSTNNGAETGIGSYVLNSDTWYKMKVTVSGLSANLFINDTNINIGRTVQNSTGSIGLTHIDNSTDYFDNVFVRKYASTDPTSSLSSTEEQSKAPVAYWSFDEGQGTIAYDATSNKNNGTLGAGASAPTWQTEDMCVSGKCLKFDGSNDLVSVSDSNSLDTLSAITVEAWIKPNQIDREQNIISKYDRDTGGVGQKSYLLRITGSNNTFMFSVSNNGSTDNTVSTTQTANANSWTHVVGRYDGSTLKIFINGVERATTNYGSGIFAGTEKLYVGARRTTDPYFNGFLDEVKIYNYARTAQEIRADYNSGSSQKGTSAKIGDKNPRESLSEGLVGYWKMEENTGTTVADSSGNGNTTTLGTGGSAPSWSTGMYGIGLSFDGSDDFISAGDKSTLESMSQLTISAWVKPTSNKSFNEIVVKNSAYTLSINNGILDSAIGTQWAWIGSGPTITNNIWSHVTMTWDGDKLKRYVNGIEMANTDRTNGSIPNNSSSTIIGGRGGGIAFNGPIDEVRIYNRALSPAEVQQLYNWAPGPVGYWKFDEHFGSSANDTSGNGNNGTLTSGPIWTTGKFGSALSFTPNAFVNGGTSPSLNIGNNITVEGWVNIDPSVSTTQGLLAKDDGSNRLFNINYESGSYFRWRIWQSDGTIKDINGATPTKGLWYHIAGVADGSYVRFYVNGVSSGTPVAYNGTIKQNQLIPFSIANYASYYLKGKIDEVKIYNYARTQKQIVEDMNAGHPAGGSPVGSQVAYYKFDEGYGTTVNNSGFGGSSLNGSFGAGSSAPTWSNDGKYGKALSFDGGDYVSLTNGISFKNLPQASVSLWFKTAVLDGAGHRLYDEPKPTLGYARFALLIGTDNKLTLGGRSQDGDSYTTWVDSNISLSVNTWYHVVAVFDSVSDIHHLYINGVAESGSVAASTFSNTDPIVPPSLGRASNNLTYWNGLIDEVKIYNYALTADEVKIDYNRGAALQMGTKSSGAGNTAPATASSQEYCIPGDTAVCSPPVGRWDFNEGIGSSAFDTSGNGNNGGLGIGNSAPTWATGKIGKGLRFDGVINDYVEANNVASGDESTWSGITISTWVQHKSYSPAPQEILRFGNNWLGNDSNLQTGGYACSLYLGTTSYTVGKGGELIPSLNTWYNVACTHDKQNVILYVNGVEIDREPSTDSISNFSNFEISRKSTPVRVVNGLIDQVRIYNYARSPAQIAWDYNKGAPVAHWKFDECEGATIHNSQFSNSNLDGTLTVGANGSQNTAGTCALGVGQSSAWANGATGKYNASLNFDGTDDYVSVGTGFTAQSVSLWVKPTSNTSSLMQLSASANITASSGLISATGFSTPTIYVNGIASTTLSADVWQMVTATTATGIPAGAIKFGLVGSTYYSGQIDDIKIWNYALTPLQIKLLYNQNSAVRFDD